MSIQDDVSYEPERPPAVAFTAADSTGSQTTERGPL